jgi:hypothetical protein
MCPICRVKFNGYSKDGKKLAPAEPPAFDRLRAIVDDLIALHKVTYEDGRLNGQAWRADIDALADKANFSGKQVAVAAEKASPTFKSMFNEAADRKKLSEALKHGFQDSLVKILSVLSFRTMDDAAYLEPEDKEIVIGYGAALQECLADIAHNYKLILPPQKDGRTEYGRVLSLYEEKTIPELIRINERLPDELGVTAGQAQDIRARFLGNWTSGKEHLNRIPAKEWQPAAAK